MTQEELVSQSDEDLRETILYSPDEEAREIALNEFERRAVARGFEGTIK